MAETNLYEIKKRVTAAKQTSKITRTMELIASSRLQRCKQQLAHYQIWKTHLQQAARCLPQQYFQPLSEKTTIGTKAYIVFCGSKGLSGSYGPSLIQYARPLVEGQCVLAVGSAGISLFPDAHTQFGDQVPSAEYAATITKTAQQLYSEQLVDTVEIIYAVGTNHATEPLLPLRPLEEQHASVIAEPSETKLYPALYEEYVQAIVYEAHLQAFVAEQIARVSAMDNATKNADEIIEDLQATYNRIRQSSITQEIISVSNAVRGDG